MAVLAIANVIGCAEPAQPTAGPERITLEHELRLVEDRYAEALSRLRHFERIGLDGRLQGMQQDIETLNGRLARLDETLDSLEGQRKDLLGQMDLAASGQRDWADKVAAVRLMHRQAEQDKAAVHADLVRAREGMAELRRLAAQREILLREALTLEKQMLALNRKLGN